ncbi:gamma-glutamylcyclotransferase [Mucilaginibacter achroorhodeus]|uniref:Gamma-glutamylcyclotransferase n=1 Tax=Mucilaginibacter achroorhodeus TaxID=2599294 RepID=A0A563U3U6_9SPHI|nr:gamma-glutamylcyclotransferase family protein [Mucilaginibacter achroorhodeus]TWR25992.1 gamma-glutamylcyclotransferase [Mucilaginibacter achroorhodeus]
MTDFLFIYGTLLQSGNEFGSYLQQNCSFVTLGHLQAQLYDLGEYPGIVISSKFDQEVHGSVFEMRDQPEILRRLDYYEGVGPDEEHPNLYRREIHPVKTNKGIMQAWVYVYNRSVEHAIDIPGGDYLKYLNKKSPGK